MTNSNKRKGDEAERAARDFLRLNGFPGTERTRAGYERDEGDLHLSPGVIAQVKNVKSPRWQEWFDGMREQIVNANADHGVLVVKRIGKGDPASWLAVMPLDAMTRLLREAGYGTPLGFESAPEPPNTPNLHTATLTPDAERRNELRGER